MIIPERTIIDPHFYNLKIKSYLKKKKETKQPFSLTNNSSKKRLIIMHRMNTHTHKNTYARLCVCAYVCTCVCKYDCVRTFIWFFLLFNPFLKKWMRIYLGLNAGNLEVYKNKFLQNKKRKQHILKLKDFHAKVTQFCFHPVRGTQL